MSGKSDFMSRMRGDVETGLGRVGLAGNSSVRALLPVAGAGAGLVAFGALVLFGKAYLFSAEDVDYLIGSDAHGILRLVALILEYLPLVLSALFLARILAGRIVVALRVEKGAQGPYRSFETDGSELELDPRVSIMYWLSCVTMAFSVDACLYVRFFERLEAAGHESFDAAYVGDFNIAPLFWLGFLFLSFCVVLFRLALKTRLAREEFEKGFFGYLRFRFPILAWYASCTVLAVSSPIVFLIVLGTLG